MAKRRAARHDPLETVIPTAAHWSIGGIDYNTGWSLLGCGSRDGDGKLRGVGSILSKGRKQEGVCGDNSTHFSTGRPASSLASSIPTSGPYHS
jgi:hypothetical protein